MGKWWWTMGFLGYPIYVNHPSPGWAAASIQNHQPTINSLYGKSVDFFLGVSEKKINILESQGWCASGNSKVSNDSIYIYCIYIYTYIYIYMYLFIFKCQEKPRGKLSEHPRSAMLRSSADFWFCWNWLVIWAELGPRNQPKQVA